MGRRRGQGFDRSEGGVEGGDEHSERAEARKDAEYAEDALRGEKEREGREGERYSDGLHLFFGLLLSLATYLDTMSLWRISRVSH